MNCARCGSQETQRFAMVYQAGTQQVHTFSHSAPYFSWAAITGIGGVVTNTDGSVSSLLANKTMPPAKQPMGMAALMLILAVVLLAAGVWLEHMEISIGGAVMLLIGSYQGWQSHSYNVRQWPDLYRQWLHQWICLRCGNTFYVP